MTWTNRDDIPHTVAEENGRFRSKALDTGDSFEHVFLEKGSFSYYCTMHPQMKGKVIVG